MERSVGVTAPHGISVARQDGGVLVTLHGAIDTTLRDAASRCMVTVVGCDGPVMIDSSGVTFIDSSGLAFLLQLHGVATDAGRAVALRDPSGAVRDLLALVGLDGHFTAEETGAP